ncbi:MULTISPECIES: ABC transporter permease [Actinomadura]|uniref:ABC-type transport system involved in multi-copper enzyme maturation, permease component n=1 Tax=Actinomadura madurae TaxID=1993 RepID=A0A1I5YZF9_9ACTN|nr:ABC transporter permease [Actinomadura madurae]SFQ49510.1 ABC-type transport system involved in multi-copper enzyme maturation, permease component [Actinomadura madurae]SPT59559.1 ABC-type transport system involved in multi-copper enzyme maturation, permease component [Actinomadura madurae]
MTGDAVAAEWRKLRSVRSTYWIMAVTFGFLLVVLLLALQSAHVWDGLSAERRAEFRLRPLQELAGWVASLCLAILGVLTVTSEYRTGMIRTSITAIPARRTLLLAKAAVVGTVALVAGEAVTVCAFLGSRLVVGDRPFVDQQESIAHDLPSFLVSGTVVPVFALLGLALGVLLRSTAGSLVSVVFVWHVLPLLVIHLPQPWSDRAASVMPGALPHQMSSLSAENSIYGDLLSPGMATAVLLAYALAPLAAAAFVFARRDA